MRKFLPSRLLLLEGWDGQTWKNHVHNCAPCHLPNVDGQIDPSLVMVLFGLWCIYASNLQELLLCWFVRSVLEVGIWDVSCHQWKKCLLANGFALDAPNRPRFLRSHSRIHTRFSSMVIHIWVGIWRITFRWLMMGFTFASGLLVLLPWNQSIHAWWISNK